MSVSKGVLATLLAILIERGQLDPEQLVARYWPEFAAADKGAITVAQLCSHQAGLAALDQSLTSALIADRHALADALARQAPIWAPGSGHGYHALTGGLYADILFERACGKGVRALLADLCPQLGIEIHSGLPVEHADRCVRVLAARPQGQGAAPPTIDPKSLAFRVLTNMPEMLASPEPFWNGETIRRIDLPGTNMFSGVRSLARLYAGLIAGGVWQGRRLCSAEAIRTVARERVRGIDRVNGAEMAFGLFFQMPSAFTPFSHNRAAYGHCGVGGSVAFADPERGLALAWLPSRFSAQSYDGRMKAVIEAVYAAL